MNLDTKLVVANLGQDFVLCCDIFGFPTLSFFDPPCLYLEVRLFAVQIVRSIYYALTLHYHEEDSQPSFRRSSTTYSDTSLGAYTSILPYLRSNSRRSWISTLYSLIRIHLASDWEQIHSRPLKGLSIWSAPDASPPPQTEIKKFMLCKIRFSPVGVLSLQQAGLLEPGDGRDADRKGYFRRKDPCFTNSTENTRELSWHTTSSPTSTKSWCNVY